MELGSPRLQQLASHPASQLAKCAQHCAQINEALMRLTPLLSAAFQRLHPLLTPEALSAPFALIRTNLYFPLCGMCWAFPPVESQDDRTLIPLNWKSSIIKLPNEKLHKPLNYIDTPSQNRDWVLFLSRRILACKPALPVCFSVKPNMAAFAFSSSRAPE